MTTLMAIGGAADFEEPTIFQEFIKRSGGAKARIVVLPQASSLANTGREYCETFQGLGLRSKPISLEFRERKDADKKNIWMHYTAQPEYLSQAGLRCGLHPFLAARFLNPNCSWPSNAARS